jgi:hypothetical protein
VLQGASLRKVFVWRADTREADWKNTRVAGPKTGPKTACDDIDADCDWIADTFKKIKWLIAEQIPEGDLRRAATERIEQRLDPTKALGREEEMAKVWASRANSSPRPDVYERSLAEQWRRTGCNAFGAPYLLRALLDRMWSIVGPFGNDSPEVPKLAAAFLDKDCAGAHGLSESDKARLKALAAPAAPQAPKP